MRFHHQFQPDSGSDENQFSNSEKLNTGIYSDSDYQNLLVYYQQGDWNKCNEIINELQSKYPGDPKVLEFKSDIEMKLLISGINIRASHEKNKKLIINGAFLIVVISILSILSVNAIKTSQQRAIANREIEADTLAKSNLKALESQVGLLLQSNHYEEAAKVILKMQEIDPDYPAIPDYQKKINDHLVLVDLYDLAINSLSEEKVLEALELFQEINSISPNYRDVVYQIDTINRKISLQNLITSGEKAYFEQNWEGAIGSFQQAYSLEEDIISPQIREKLLLCYLNSIVETLSNESPAISEIEKAGIYYQKAIALIPQDSGHIGERIELQQMSVDLLEIKDIQVARSILADQNHSELLVMKAIGFLRSAAALKPDRQDIPGEIRKAEKYLEALRLFNQKKWDGAINKLNELATFDSNYPNGMIPVLLYEANMYSGLKYFNGGFYLDARKRFELAEILAWENTDKNKLRLFKAQIYLGLTLGKLEDYKNSVSYFLYALKSIEDTTEFQSNNDLMNLKTIAERLNKEGKYYDAYLIMVDTLNENTDLYLYQEVAVYSGDNLAYYAEKYHSTMMEIVNNNNIEFPLVSSSQKINIPYLP